MSTPPADWPFEPNPEADAWAFEQAAKAPPLTEDQVRHISALLAAPVRRAS